MAQIQLQIIPKEMIDIIPRFEGDDKQLDLFIRKAEYVIQRFRGIGENARVQDEYVFHSVTSRLIGRAATLLSERGDLVSWNQLKVVLRQHFGDPRSEQCIAIELENLKIKQGESYTDFCNRIQHVRSTLFAKVNEIDDAGLRSAKTIIYNNTALNSFMYNLPEYMLRIVRLRGCTTLESALGVVTEEVNFQYQYNSKNHTRPMPLQQNAQPRQIFQPPPQNRSFSVPQQNNFRFGIPQTLTTRPYGFQPTSTPNQGFRFGIPNQPRPGFRPTSNQVFGYGAPQQYNGFRFGVPAQQGYRPLTHQGFNQQTVTPGFRFGVPPVRPNQRTLDNTDVTMRTVRQNNLVVPCENDNLCYSDSPQCMDNEYYYEEEPFEPTHIEEISEEIQNEEQNIQESENFRVTASNKPNR
jgi:hypothetical protein